MNDRDYEKEIEKLREDYKYATADRREIIKRQARFLQIAKEKRDKKKEMK